MTLNKITTLEQLIYNLNLGAGYSGYKNLINQIQLNPKELNELCDWMSQKHMRIGIYDTPSLEAIITYWKPGHASPIHNYNFQQGWIKVLQGSLELEYFDITEGVKDLELLDAQTITTGNFTYLNDSLGFHRFKNSGTEETIAIHIYADKITEWSVFDENTGEIKTVDTSYDKVIE
ncbi:MAG: cysteine dioxygenase family protein [Salibacteraceae bacterium]